MQLKAEKTYRDGKDFEWFANVCRVSSVLEANVRGSESDLTRHVYMVDASTWSTIINVTLSGRAR